eukprot:TRINITY_DN1128_c0_g1_i1.p3 TRINITY_DN1128_c0_g1~~TRINITY_DN1128_c0_g1_i1.p3  ORF type:complete len:304 (-),score=15.69 TRINITY_DN1128_c0_g1_i1:318-1229(-)
MSTSFTVFVGTCCLLGSCVAQVSFLTLQSNASQTQNRQMGTPSQINPNFVAGSSQSIGLQSNPLACSESGKVLCWQADPCETRLNQQLKHNTPACPGYRDALCIRYACSDPLIMNGIPRPNMVCEPVFYIQDPNTLTPIPVDCGKFSAPTECQYVCEAGDESGSKSVCCGDTTYPNKCLAQCDGGYSNPDIQCKPGNCSQQGQNIPQCISGCFAEDMQLGTPYCCNSIQYDGPCSARCWVDDKLEEECQVGRCADLEAQKKWQFRETTPGPHDNAQNDELKHIDTQMLMESLSKFSVQANQGN